MITAGSRRHGQDATEKPQDPELEDDDAMLDDEEDEDGADIGLDEPEDDAD
jgi:hypothetical protein